MVMEHPTYFDTIPPIEGDNGGCSDGFLPITGRTILPSVLQGVDIPPRQWNVEDWIPHGTVTGLYGDGGVGKSLLAMMLMTCLSQGFSFLGLPTLPTKAFGFFCEDSEDELHRRQHDINRHYGCEFQELKNVAWQSRIGCDNVLMSFKNGIGTPTAIYKTLREQLLDLGTNFAVIDTAADTFGGNENIRTEVRQFINLLAALAKDIGGSVLLCAHPSAAGLANNSGTGGSTAWNNTLRSRFYLRRPQLDKDEMTEEESQGLRELVNMKSNYAASGGKITLRWERGAFVTDGQKALDMVDQIKDNLRDKEDNNLFMKLLDELASQNRVVSDSSRSNSNYAPRVMKTLDAANGTTVKRLENAMFRLFDAKIIKIGVAGEKANRVKKDGIIRVVSSSPEFPSS